MIRIVEAKGTHLEIGEQLGEQCKEIAHKLRHQFRVAWHKRMVTIDKAIAHSRKFHPYASEFYQPYIDELTGYARATGLNPDEVFAWFCYDPPAPKGCTDFVINHRVTGNGRTYMAHNEDYDVQEEEYAVLAKVKPNDAPAFMAMAYGGIWFNAGVNEAGIGIAGTGLDYNDSRYGIPADFSFRKMYSARTLGEAMEYSTPAGRCGSYCNIIANSSGEMYAMEASATDFVALHDRNFLAHSNHYLSEKMEKYDNAFLTKEDRSPGFYSDSIVRYNRARNLIQDAFDHSRLRNPVPHIKKILSDHINQPWALCRHIDESLPEHERSKTVFSQVINVTDREMHLCKGNPCENEYRKYTL